MSTYLYDSCDKLEAQALNGVYDGMLIMWDSAGVDRGLKIAEFNAAAQQGRDALVAFVVSQYDTLGQNRRSAYYDWFKCKFVPGAPQAPCPWAAK